MPFVVKVRSKHCQFFARTNLLFNCFTILDRLMNYQRKPSFHWSALFVIFMGTVPIQKTKLISISCDMLTLGSVVSCTGVTLLGTRYKDHIEKLITFSLTHMLTSAKLMVKMTLSGLLTSISVFYMKFSFKIQKSYKNRLFSKMHVFSSASWTKYTSF